MAITIDPVSAVASLIWRAHANCRDLDTTLFFPIGVTGPAAAQTAVAKSICADCTVRVECLDFAVTTNQEFGVWGGLTEDERRVVRRRWRAGQRRHRQAEAEAEPEAELHPAVATG